VAAVHLPAAEPPSNGPGADSAGPDWAEDVLVEEARRPFDLARGPVLRARLLRTGPDEHVLSLVVHHIAADGWSLRILWGELATLYAAHAEGRPPLLPPLPIQYADWAAWQRAWLGGGELDRRRSRPTSPPLPAPAPP
jgi:hypothetical protein